MNKIEFEKVIPDKESSFNAHYYENVYFDVPLHFHPEFELLLILEGDGFCFCGDYVGYMQPGDIMLFGKSLPHFCLSDKRYYEPNCREKCKSACAQFKEEIFPIDYLYMPGFKNIQNVLKDSQRGVCFSASKLSHIAESIQSLPIQKGLQKIITLYSILDELGQQMNLKYFASLNYQTLFIPKDYVFHKTIQYINSHYQSDIKLADIAENVCMNKSSLCRHFKKLIGKSIFEYIIEFRISYACKLLANTDTNISTIAYDSGFNNLSHFNYQFKIVTGFTPKEYRNLFLLNA